MNSQILFKSSTNKWLPFLCFLIIAFQNPIWPFWSFSGYISFFCIPIVALLMLNRKRRYMSFSYFLSVFFLFLAFIVIQQIREFTPSSFLYFITFLFVLKIRDSEKETILLYLTQYLCIIVAISFPFWFIHSYITPLPLYGIIDISSMKVKEGLYLENYFFFVNYPNTIFPRFWSMFGEPGVLGTLGAFVLYANDYNYKDKKNLIIFIGCLFTFSLAFYVLTIIGLISKSIHGSSIKTMISLALVISLFGVIDYLLRDNDTYNYVVKMRMEEGLDNSLVARASERTNAYFERFAFTQDAVFGIGTAGANAKGLLSQGNSYRHFIIRFGWISVFALVLAYWSLSYPRNKKMLTFYIIILLSFLQRSQMWVAWELILYVCVSLPEKSISNQLSRRRPLASLVEK